MKYIRGVLLIVIAATVLFFVACTKQTVLDTKNPVQVTVWHYYNGSQLEAFNKMVREFNYSVGNELGIYVEASSEGGVNDLAEHILDIIDGVAGEGGLPDIFAAYPDTAYEVKNAGYTIDLTDYMTTAEIQQYETSFWQEGCLPPDGVATIFPIAKATEVIFIDDLAWQQFVAEMEAVGIFLIAEECFGTWEGIVEVATLYYEHTGKAMFGIDSVANFLFTTMYQQNMKMAESLKEDGSLVWTEAAFRKSYDLYFTASVKGAFGAVGRYRSDDVKTGEIIGYIGSTTGAVYFPDKITYEDGRQSSAELKAYPMPIFEGGKQIAVQQGAGMVVTKSNERQEYAAVEFLKWMTEKEQNLQFSLDSSYLPVKSEVLYGEDMEALLIEMDNSTDSGVRNASKVFSLALEQMNTHEAYYTIPFSGLFELRQQLDSLENHAKEAMKIRLLLESEGVSYEDAINQVLTEDAYYEFREHLIGGTVLRFE